MFDPIYKWYRHGNRWTDVRIYCCRFNKISWIKYNMNKSIYGNCRVLSGGVKRLFGWLFSVDFAPPVIVIISAEWSQVCYKYTVHPHHLSQDCLNISFGHKTKASLHGDQSPDFQLRAFWHQGAHEIVVCSLARAQPEEVMTALQLTLPLFCPPWQVILWFFSQSRFVLVMNLLKSLTPTNMWLIHEKGFQFFVQHFTLHIESRLQCVNSWLS